jgi:DNA-binding CsgD family transcriptional regulator
MTTKLTTPLKREITVDGETYVVAVDVAGMIHHREAPSQRRRRNAPSGSSSRAPLAATERRRTIRTSAHAGRPGRMNGDLEQIRQAAVVASEHILRAYERMRGLSLRPPEREHTATTSASAPALRRPLERIRCWRVFGPTPSPVIQRAGPVLTLRRGFSPRERAIAEMIGDGKSYREIADQLEPKISPRTVESYVGRMAQKVDVALAAPADDGRPLPPLSRELSPREAIYMLVQHERWERRMYQNGKV